MSELMLHGVLNMPIDLWGDDLIDKIQRHSRYVEASKIIKDAENKRQQSIELALNEVWETWVNGKLPKTNEPDSMNRILDGIKQTVNDAIK